MWGINCSPHIYIIMGTHMTPYILILFATFDDESDVEFFCSEIFPILEFKNLKFVIEGFGHMVITFDSDKSHKEIAMKIFDLLSTEYIKLYFLYERDSIVSTCMPKEMINFIYRRVESDGDLMRIEYSTKTEKNKPQPVLDEILDKIDRTGIESLSEDEKNFLDSFGN